MTGIAAVMTADGRPPDETMLTAMANAIAGRGDDNRRRYVVGDVGMIEVGGGPQAEDRPLVHGDDGYFLVADARLLPGQDGRSGDIDGVATGFARKEQGFADDLQGMFGIILHDQEERRLAVTRDRFGVKPLYYTESNAGFAVASSPGALLAVRNGPPDIRPDVRDELLQLQFTTGRETIFANIYRVLPGETLIVSRGRVVERERGETLPAGGPHVSSETDALNELDRLLHDRLEDYVPQTGPAHLLLSGGVDSAVLLALLKARGKGAIHTYTVEVETKGADSERKIAEDLARRAGTTHRTVHVEEADFWRLLPTIVAAVADPVADYAMLPLWVLAEAIADETDTVLTGDGADEFFAGYGRYRSAVLPWWRGGRAMRHRGILDGTRILDHEPTGWRDGIVGAESNAAAVAGRSALQVAQAVDVADWLPNDVLTKVDACFTSHGIEPRMPFLDPQIATFAYELADGLKVRGRKGKYLLRWWLERNLPGVGAFRAKRGLSVPVGPWIGNRAADLAPLVAGQPGIADCCNAAAVRKLFGSRGRHVDSAQWLLLFFALWHQIHIMGVKPEGGVLDTLAEKS